KQQAMAEATKGAILVPFGVLERTPAVVEIAGEVLEIGNPNAASDAATAAACAVACAEGALYNVLTNMKDFEGDAEWAADVRARALKLVDDVRSSARQVSESFVDRM
ncbi:MAG: cyclodeaminase/cyclohydrolase family protein, partial [Planctomycetes bacterium]|nr:cyclodeaminase/cyclohydrolase family protein [Planctomycetota bacterium]